MFVFREGVERQNFVAELPSPPRGLSLSSALSKACFLQVQLPEILVL